MEATPAVGEDRKRVRQGPDRPVQDQTDATRDIPQEDVERARVYGLLARVLAEPMSEETLAAIRAVDEEAGGSDLGRAFASLGGLARRATLASAEEEFAALFIGEGAGGELLPYASHYLTGFLLEKPLANVRGDLMELGIGASGVSKEPEDHIAFLCEVMHGLITGTLGEPRDLATQKDFFRKHLLPWAVRFFEDLERARSAALYMPVGTIGKLFMAIENEAFETAA